MDPKAIEITNLRAINDYLNQTIDILSCAQCVGVTPTTYGLAHSPYAPTSVFRPAITGAGVNPALFGLRHSSYGWPVVGSYTWPASWQNSPFGVASAASVVGNPYTNVVDPFAVHRGLSHSALVGQAFNPSWQTRLVPTMFPVQPADAIARWWGTAI